MTADRVTSPLHVADVGQGRLRFFRSPTPEPGLPWHCHDDLLKCLGLPRPVRRELQKALANGPFAKDVKAAATPDGVVVIAPHFAAQGLLGAALEMDHPGVAEVERAYVDAATEAMRRLTGDLPPEARVDFLLKAARHQELSQGDGGAA